MTDTTQTQVDPRLEQLREKILIVATPCYGGMVNDRYCQGIFNLVSLCNQYGVKLGYITIANESLVTRARNELVNSFLNQTEGTHLMFIDADINFDAKDVLRMLLADKDVVVGAYPLKQIDWANAMNAVERRATPQEVIDSTAMYVINVAQPDSGKVGEQITVPITEGMVEVWDAGTGFMLMKREMIESMVKKYPETRYLSDKDMTLPVEQRERYALFDTMIDEDGRYLSEDYTFCRRWQKMGGKIHMDVNVKLDHVGTYVFKGSNFIKRQDSSVSASATSIATAPKKSKNNKSNKK